MKGDGENRGGMIGAHFLYQKKTRVFHTKKNALNHPNPPISTLLLPPAPCRQRSGALEANIILFLHSLVLCPVDEVENQANPAVLSQFPPANVEGILRHIGKERHQAIFLAFRALCNSGRVKGRHVAASVRPLRHPS